MEKQLYYRVPTRFDQRPYKFMWYFSPRVNALEIWIQCSEDIENPEWKRFGHVFEEFYNKAESMQKFYDEVLWFCSNLTQGPIRHDEGPE